MRNLIEGTDKAEILTGAATEDLIRGLAGADRLLGKIGSDVLQGGLGADTLDGGLGLDFVRGGPGDDRVFISGGRDRLKGDAGNDWLDASKWQDGIYWNLLSFDTTDFTTGVRITSGTLKIADAGDSDLWREQTATGFENFNGSASRDFVTTLGEFNIVNLRGGDDSFTAAKVNVVRGNLGADRINIKEGLAEGGLGNDTLSGGSAVETKSATLRGGRGDDLLIVSLGEARGGPGADRFLVTDFSDQLFGGPGADVFEFNPNFGQGIMRDFRPGVDKIDISGYLARNGETWTDLQTMFEPHAEGVALRFDLQSFSNQTFVFAGLERADLSESDFILV